MQLLTEIVAELVRTNLAPKFRIGTHSQSISGILDAACFLPSVSSVPLWQSASSMFAPSRPRTSVLNLPIPLRHRFFFRPRAHSAHDRAHATRLVPPPRLLVVCIFHRDLARLRSHPSRRHTRRNPLRSRRRLLLQVLSFKNEIRLHENLRTAPLRFALVGYFLCQTPRLVPIR